MLSVQPVSVATSQKVRNVNFGNRSSFTVETPDDENYNKKTKFYEKQKNEFENIINDEEAPEILKKMGRFFKVVSEALFNGWLVAWGASKGAKFVKSSVASGLNSKAAENLKTFAKPLGEKFTTLSGAVAGGIASVGERIKATNVYTNISKKLTNLAEKLDGDKYGQYVMAGLRFVGSGVKSVLKLIAKPFEKLAEKVKGAEFDKAYDKAAKFTSTTLGVGAGAASAYDEAVHPETQKMYEPDKADDIDKDKKEFDDEVKSHLDDIDDIPNEEEE